MTNLNKPSGDNYIYEKQILLTLFFKEIHHKVFESNASKIKSCKKHTIKPRYCKKYRSKTNRRSYLL